MIDFGYNLTIFIELSESILRKMDNGKIEKEISIKY